MGKKMGILSGLIFVILLLGMTTAFAAENVYKDPKGFSLTFPAGWLSEKMENYDVVYFSPDKKAFLGVAAFDLPAKVKASVLLQKIEDKMGVENLFEASEVKVSKAYLKKIGANEGAIGKYELETGEGVTMCWLAVFISGKKAYVLTKIIEQSLVEQYSQVADEAAATFKISK